MSITVFRNAEAGYRQWLVENKDGYVLSTPAQISPEYMTLHKSTCRMISKYMKTMGLDAFTGRRFIKICSNNSAELESWASEYGGLGIRKLCSHCSPPKPEIIEDDIAAYHLQLEAAVRTAGADKQARLLRLAGAPRVPSTFVARTTVFRRNPDVIAEALDMAAGVCQQCEKPAPFRKVVDNAPYLEVHHRTPLFKGGEDTVLNAIAVCPNCHREAHFGHRKVGS